MATKRCPKCDAEYELHERFCTIDGAVLRGPDISEGLEGSIIAGREVLRLLGEGGMGRVYLAKSIRVGRLDALKVMHAEFTKSADAVARFNREAMNAVRILHPNVAIVYDVGDTDDGLPYLAMEYIDGESLRDILRKVRPFPAARAAGIIRQVAAALDAAHRLGIVHRDLKPENVMIGRQDNADVVKLVDFGISKVAGAADQQVTSTGVTIGSPAYMSPEQVLGGVDITAQSDIYSLALVAYELLSGRLPFDGEGTEMVMARLSTAPRPLWDVCPGTIRNEELERVLARGLAADLHARYTAAMDFGRDFERAAGNFDSDGETVAFEPAKHGVSPSGGARGKWLSAKLRTASLAAGMLATGAVGVWLLTRPGTARDDVRGDIKGGAPSRAVSDSTPTVAPRRAAVTSPPRVAFGAPSLRIGVAALPVAARPIVDSAVRVAAQSSVVTIADRVGDATDIELRPGAGGRIAVAGNGFQGANIGAASDSVLAFIRYAIAVRDLEGVSTRANAGDLVFVFDAPTSRMYVGDQFRFHLRSRTGGYLMIIDVAPSGHLSVLAPNEDMTDIQRLAANVETVLPERTRPGIATGPPAGAGQLWAIVTSRPLALPPSVSKDGSKGAAHIRRELERLVGAGGARWFMAVLPYDLAMRR